MSQEGVYSELLQILQEAVQREIMAAKLYAEAAEKATYPRAKELLEKLASEERHHKDILSALYEEIAGEALYTEAE